MNPRIDKLEALLSRIRTNAQAPRAHAAPAAEPVASHEGSPSAEIAVAPEPDTQVSAHAAPERPRVEAEIEVPLESRARLVAAPHTDVDEEIEAEEVLELDERHMVQEESPTDVSANATAAPPAAELDEPPPPSSRRPIAEPAESPQEAEIRVAHTPPPESGKQVAVEALSFDDDLTGVREAHAPRDETPPRVAPEPSIQLQSLRMPAVQAPKPADEMELELPGSAAPSQQDETRPPPGPLPEMRAPRIESIPEPEPTQVSAEITRPTRPVAAAQVAEMIGTVKPGSPKTFGELLDLTLSL